jgi:hypothetical protein
MENKNQLSWILFILLLVLYLSGFIFVMVAYVAPAVRHRRKSKSNSVASASAAVIFPVATTCTMPTNQTTFFRDSTEVAKKNLFGKMFLDGYKYGSAVDLTKLDDATKQQISTAMDFMMIDPITSRTIENNFRAISETENVPLWFVILHESIKKLIPVQMGIKPNLQNLSDEELKAELRKRNAEENTENPKIVSINKVA